MPFETSVAGTVLRGRIDAVFADPDGTHPERLIDACWTLGGTDGWEGLRRWAHMLGFRGHWSTKSRRYSTTFTVLRRARVAFAKRRRAKDGVPLDAWGRPEDDDQVVIVASWVFVGAGYEAEGSAGWPCRRPPALVSTDASPARNWPPQPEPLHDPRRRGEDT